MDRYLLLGAIALLILEVFVLLNDLQLLPRSDPWGAPTTHLIGEVKIVQNNVRKKNQGNLSWESPEKNDQLYAFDSVLTLKDSSALLRLQNNTTIQLHENTLVVLEPDEQSQDGSLRLRFRRGALNTTTAGSPATIAAAEWTLKTQPQAQISLRALPDNKIAVEVEKGSVEIKHADKKEILIQEGSLSELGVDGDVSQSRISTALLWKSRDQRKVYTHEDRPAVDISWQGPASRLKHLNPENQIEELTLEASTQHTTLALSHGTHFFNLTGDGQTSSTLTMHVLPAPRIVYFSPLPRDRGLQGKPLLFSWSKVDPASSYRIEFFTIPNAVTPEFSWSAETAMVKRSLDKSGAFQWGVSGVDADGFTIPYFYLNTIYSLDSALAAPRLKAPALLNPQRGPAQQQKKRPPLKKTGQILQPLETNRQSWTATLWRLAFPDASADEPIQRLIRFTWYPVPEADQYTIEVSTSPDFLNLVVNEVIPEEAFEWSTYEKKVYFWRVAAAQKSGKMGLFSEAARVDLSHLPPAGSLELSPGVEIRVQRTAPVSPAASETKNPPPPPTAPPAPEPELLPQDKFSQWKIKFGTQYLSSDSRNGDVNSAFKGYTTHYDLSLNFPLRKRGSILLDIESYEVRWKRQSSGSLPLQRNIDQFFFHPSIFYRPASSSFGYGISGRTVQRPRRIGNEEITLSSAWSWGGSWFYSWVPRENWEVHHKMGLEKASSLTLVSLENALDGPLGKIAIFQLSAGVGLNLNFMTGSASRRGTEKALIFNLGVKW